MKQGSSGIDGALAAEATPLTEIAAHKSTKAKPNGFHWKVVIKAEWEVTWQ
jgi:hypothetical protein